MSKKVLPLTGRIRTTSKQNVRCFFTTYFFFLCFTEPSLWLRVKVKLFPWHKLDKFYFGKKRFFSQTAKTRTWSLQKKKRKKRTNSKTKEAKLRFSKFELPTPCKKNLEDWGLGFRGWVSSQRGNGPLATNKRQVVLPNHTAFVDWVAGRDRVTLTFILRDFEESGALSVDPSLGPEDLFGNTPQSADP